MRNIRTKKRNENYSVIQRYNILVKDEELEFLRGLQRGLKPFEAYMLAYPNSSVQGAKINSTKKMREERLQLIVKDIQDDLWSQMKDDAKEAYAVELDLMRTGKDSMRHEVAKSLLDRAGFSPVQKRMDLSLKKNLDADIPPEKLNELFFNKSKEIETIKEEIKQLKNEQNSGE